MEKKRHRYSFTAWGHPNILAKHVKTLEFTKDEDITEAGDCIVGVRSDFDSNELKEFGKKAKMIISVEDPKTGETLSSEFKFKINKEFNSEDELVLRKSFFNSDRTFGFGLNRGANWLDRRIVELIQNKETKINVEVVEGWF